MATKDYIQDRSFKFICFQNKADHYQKLKTMKPDINTSLNPKSPVYKKLKLKSAIGATHRMNNKRINQVNRNIQIENEKLCKKLQEIMNTKPVRLGSTTNRANTPNNVQLRTYGFYEKFYKPMSKITKENKKLAHRLLSARPLIGDNQSWSEHHAKSLSNSRLIRHFDQSRSPNPSPYLHLTPQSSQHISFVKDHNLQNSTNFIEQGNMFTHKSPVKTDRKSSDNQNRSFSNTSTKYSFLNNSSLGTQQFTNQEINRAHRFQRERGSSARSSGKRYKNAIWNQEIEGNLSSYEQKTQQTTRTVFTPRQLNQTDLVYSNKSPEKSARVYKNNQHHNGKNFFLGEFNFESIDKKDDIKDVNQHIKNLRDRETRCKSGLA